MSKDSVGSMFTLRGVTGWVGLNDLVLLGVHLIGGDRLRKGRSFTLNRTVEVVNLLINILGPIEDYQD